MFWKGAQSIPSMKAVSLFEKKTGKEFIPNESEEALVTFLEKMKPELCDADSICEIIHWASPYLRSAVIRPAPYLCGISEVWHIPFVDERDKFKGYFNNMTKGIVELITFSAQSGLVIKEICQGLRM